MFKKLLSNLPFNPSLLNQVGFYTKRLKKEAVVRGAGLVTLGLAFVVQSFATISPAQASLQGSSNDIIFGGFTTQQQLVDYCLHPETERHKDFDKILDYYQVTCGILKSSATTTTYIRSNAADYHSLGRNKVGNPSPRNNKNWTIYQVDIKGVARPLWMKDLQYWDSHAYSTYKVVKTTNKQGKTIYFMYDCGNIVTIGKYVPPTPPKTPTPTPPVQPPTLSPNLSYNKTATNQTRNIADANKTVAGAGDVIIYTLSVTNSGNGAYKDFVFDEDLNDVLEYADMNDFGGGTLDNQQHLTWPARSIPASGTIKVQFAVKVKSPIPATPQSTSDPGSFDLCMMNVFYDKTVTICVKPPVNKQIETTATTLPNTGPGTSLMIGAGIIAIMGYFYARNRLMVDELTIVRDEYAAGGMV